jgi:hypothetical protein
MLLASVAAMSLIGCRPQPLEPPMAGRCYELTYPDNDLPVFASTIVLRGDSMVIGLIKAGTAGVLDSGYFIRPGSDSLTVRFTSDSSEIMLLLAGPRDSLVGLALFRPTAISTEYLSREVRARACPFRG